MFSSFKRLVCCSVGTVNVVADCAGLGVLSSISELPQASKLSGMSGTDTVVSVQELRDVDMATKKESCAKHPEILTADIKSYYEHVNDTRIVARSSWRQDLRNMHDK